MWQIHATTTQDEEEEDTPHIDTWRNVRVWIKFFDGSIDGKKNYDIRERNVTIRSEIWGEDILTLEFQDIRE